MGVSTGSYLLHFLILFGNAKKVRNTECWHDFTGSAETKVTYLPDGAVVVVFPSNLTVALETDGNPILENSHQMHFKRKLIAPSKLVHRLEWRFYLRRKGRTKESILKLGRRMRVGEVFTRHESMLDSHETGSYKEKALLVCLYTLAHRCTTPDVMSHLKLVEYWLSMCTVTIATICSDFILKNVIVILKQIWNSGVFFCKYWKPLADTLAYNVFVLN